MRAYLVPESGPKAGQRVAVGREAVLGRTADSDLVIEDSAASRRHVTVKARNGGFFWEDMDSTNGTFINDVPMLKGKLAHGDRIRIGSTTVLFEVEPDEDDERPPDDHHSFFRGTIVDETGAFTPSEETGEVDNLLLAVCSVMNDIATIYEPCSLVDSILQTTMRAIDAQRGAILFTGDTPGALKPCPVCNFVHLIRDGVLTHAATSDIRISSTVVHRVLSGGESVLFKDTGSDGELNMAESIMRLSLRSIICVPIRGKYGILGILYIDSDRPNTRYTHQHMLLTTAVGNSAGLALENARMHQAMLDKQRIEQELAYAGTIQEGFLIKKWPQDDARFKVYGETRPAKIVGGDFYDLIRPNADTVGLLIGDVSGKGVPAALSMAQLLAEFRACAARELSPVKVLEDMNKSFFEKSQRGMFCTLCYLTVNVVTGEVICVNAGHHPALRITNNGSEEFGHASGVPIGILRHDTWTDVHTKLEPGDAILMYTDGIVEAHRVPTQNHGTIALHKRAPHREYGIENLLNILEGMREADPKDLVNEVIKDVNVFCMPSIPHDDCTMIGLRFVGG